MYKLYLPFIGTKEADFGTQVDGKCTIKIIDKKIYQTPDRWGETNSWFASNITLFGNNPFIVGMRGCPVEYRLWEDKVGSPPREDCYQHFTDHACNLVDTYNIPILEICNEPNVENTLPNPEQYWFGAWVENGDYYGAGRRYGDLLSACYPSLHAKGVKVLGGALNGEATSIPFLQGMLETGKCDYVSFHCYTYQGTDFVQEATEKINRIRNFTDKPLFITEVALISPEGLVYDTEVFRALQVEFFIWLKKYLKVLGIPFLWYSSDNTWRNCGLWRRGEPMPIWFEWIKGE